MYCKFPAENFPLLLEDSKEFISEWRAAIEDINKDITLLYSILRPFINQWMSLLRREEYSIKLSVLLQRLSKNFTSLDLLDRWIEITDDIESELTLILVEVIRELKYFPSQAKGPSCQYVFSYLFVNKLAEKIKTDLQSDTFELEYFQEPYCENINEDYFLLENISNSNWEKYLLYLISNGFNTSQISEVSKLPRETIYNEDKQIWHQLKKSWQTTSL